MSNKNVKNLPASIRQRLLNMAHEQNVEFGLLLTSYVIERLLYRLASSAHSERFVLKGAMLLQVWGGEIYRPTRDLDLLAFGSPELAEMTDVFRDICQVECPADGLHFLEDTIRAEEIRENQSYDGIRVRIEVQLAGAKIPVRIDVGFGDVVIPDPTISRFPTILEMPVPHLRMYSMESVIAEKFEAMVSIGAVNSRMKDYLDIYMFASNRSFDGRVISDAIKSTFERRGTPFPRGVPDALTEEFANSNDKRIQWDSFVKRIGLRSTFIDLDVVAELLRGFLMPPASAVAKGNEFDFQWTPDGHWSLK
jgi:predicted nucleotidyltransferase component of viral defense system